MAILESAIFWIVIAALSEIIALTPLKSNSVVQLILQAVKSVKPSKKVWYLKMVAGSFNMTLVVIMKGLSVLFRHRSFIKHFHIKSTKLLKRSKNLLNQLNMTSKKKAHLVKIAGLYP